MALQKLQHATRQQIFTALYNLVQTLPAPPGSTRWNTVTQEIKEWDAYSAAQQPVLTLARGAQNFQLKAVGTTRLQWRLALLIYFRTEGYQTSNSYPDQITDPVLDSIEQLFTPVMANQYFTLGGLVQNCWIDGNVYSDPGIVDSQAIVLVPISIVA